MKSLSQFVNESLPSGHQIDDKVDFYPMYQHQQNYGLSADVLSGRIVSVKFTEAKVLYTIVDNYYGKIFDDVDSSKVYASNLLAVTESVNEHIIEYSKDSLSNVMSQENIDIACKLMPGTTMQCRDIENKNIEVLFTSNQEPTWAINWPGVKIENK